MQGVVQTSQVSLNVGAEREGKPTTVSHEKVRKASVVGKCLKADMAECESAIWGHLVHKMVGNRFVNV